MLLKLDIDVLCPAKSRRNIERREQIFHICGLVRPTMNVSKPKKSKDQEALRGWIAVGFLDSLKLYIQADMKHQFAQALNKISKRFYELHNDADQIFKNNGSIPCTEIYDSLLSIGAKHIILHSWGMKMTLYQDFINRIARFEPIDIQNRLCLYDLAVDMPLKQIIEERCMNSGIPVFMEEPGNGLLMTPMFTPSDLIFDLNVRVGGYTKFFKGGEALRRQRERNTARDLSALDFAIYSAIVHPLMQLLQPGFHPHTHMPKNYKTAHLYLKKQVQWIGSIIQFLENLSADSLENILMLRFEIRIDNGSQPMSRMAQEETYFNIFEAKFPKQFKVFLMPFDAYLQDITKAHDMLRFCVHTKKLFLSGNKSSNIRLAEKRILNTINNLVGLYSHMNIDYAHINDWMSLEGFFNSSCKHAIFTFCYRIHYWCHIS